MSAVLRPGRDAWPDPCTIARPTPGAYNRFPNSSPGRGLAAQAAGSDLGVGLFAHSTKWRAGLGLDLRASVTSPAERRTAASKIGLKKNNTLCFSLSPLS